MTHRSEKIADAIYREVSAILLFELVNPRVKGVTLTKVILTRDLGIARIYFTKEGTDREREVILQGLENAKSFVRRELAKRIKIKFMPDIQFFYDNTEEVMRKISGLMEGVGS